MEIASGVHSLAHPRRGYSKGGYVHAFLVDDGDRLILVDTLFDVDAQVVLDEIARSGRTIKGLKYILLTHGHRAHLGGLATLKRLSGATVYSHEWEADIISGDRPQQGVSLLPREPLAAYPIVLIGQLLGALGRHKPCPVDQFLRDGDQVGPLHVIHTPGHTPGHLAFYWPERRVLISGDAFVTWPYICPGWPSAMLNAKQTLASLRRMAELDAEVIGAGHGDPITQNGAAVMGELAAKRKV